MKISLLLLLSIYFTQASWGNILLEDSLRKERKNNKTYIVHQVDSGETLAGIAQRYNVEIHELLTENPTIKNARIRGNKVYVPVSSSSVQKYQVYRIKKGETLESLAKKFLTTKEKLIEMNNIQNPDKIKEGSIIKVALNSAVKIPAWVHTPIIEMPVYHSVNEKETIYQLSIYYGTKQDSIRIWNNRTSNKILPSENLIVAFVKDSVQLQQLLQRKKQKEQELKQEKEDSKTQETSESDFDSSITAAEDSLSKPVSSSIVSRQMKKETTTTNKFLQDSGTVVSKDENIVVMEENPYQRVAIDTSKVQQVTEKDNLSTGSVSEATHKGIVREKGVALMILTGDNDIQKPIALHRTAPIGSFLLVVNPKNAQQVAVRVVGKIEDEPDEKVILKISKFACSQIGISESPSEVEVEYKVQ